MGIQSIANTCSHLQNASRARLALTSIPLSKYNLNLSIALHRAGYLSSITRGGPSPPDPETAATQAPEPVTHANVATRRLWLGLKYWDGKPVMAKLKPISTPKRLVTIKLDGLQRIVRGLTAKELPGLTLGESLFLSTDIGVLEAREAVERNRGGLLLCKVS
ncbi:related to MRPS8 - mitochondrial ribosomal protein, small subunit [Cephalotrichum gorgonifer]|uniref:Related to MRPS8 - mitochondrial ribosomal protein, small subunit n=1 Tax=Cephalotrichum gorgonifer TaxID=2041049 RepID=A0AAE8SYW5_9PEZI|nr:related to MRPS8 - mitochondrial ribosomal protein, small subunit [Cephalotrichum gorgonifer]